MRFRILAYEFFNLSYLSFEQCSMIDMYVSGYLLLTFCYLNDLMEELLHPFASLAHGGHDGCAKQDAQLLHVELVATFAQFVIHVEGDNHGHVHVDELGGQVEVTLQVGGIDDVDDKVGVLLDDVLSYIELLGGVGREGIGAGQIDEVKMITLEVEVPHFGIYGHA